MVLSSIGSTDRYCLDMGCRDKVQTTTAYCMQYHISTAHVQSVPHLYIPHPVFILSLQSMFREYPITTAQIQTVPYLCSTSTAYVKSISPAHVQSIRHLTCLYSQYTIQPADHRQRWWFTWAGKFLFCLDMDRRNGVLIGNGQKRQWHEQVRWCTDWLLYMIRWDGVLTGHEQVRWCTDYMDRLDGVVTSTAS